MSPMLLVPAVVLGALAWVARRGERVLQAEIASLSAATARLQSLRDATVALAVETEATTREYGRLTDV